MGDSEYKEGSPAENFGSRRLFKLLQIPIQAAPIVSPEINEPSEFSDALQDIATTELLKAVPEAFIVSGPRHHCSSKISEN